MKGLIELVHEGDDGKDIQEDHPSYEYKKYVTKMSIYDSPVGPSVVFNLARIVIPKVMRSATLDTLHKFHFTAAAMIAAAENHCWWPAINS